MKVALLQITSSDDPKDNLAVVRAMLAEAVAAGAEFVLTPEVSNCVSTSRTWQNNALSHEQDDPFLAAIKSDARALGVWVLIGSLGLKTDDADGRFANRSILIDPQGDLVARYDKIHMFDVQVTPEETYRESDGYRPGTQAVVAHTSFATVGLAVCYDVRFPALFRRLAQAGAQIITVPAAFSHVTGAAHWEVLLRARAIETGCFVLAPAQTGTHHASRGQARHTYGHSMVISPWGDILADAGDTCGITYVDLDLEKVAQARQRVPSLSHDRKFDGP